MALISGKELEETVSNDLAKLQAESRNSGHLSTEGSQDETLSRDEFNQQRDGHQSNIQDFIFC